MSSFTLSSCCNSLLSMALACIGSTCRYAACNQWLWHHISIVWTRQKQCLHWSCWETRHFHLQTCCLPVWQHRTKLWILACNCCYPVCGRARSVIHWTISDMQSIWSNCDCKNKAPSSASSANWKIAGFHIVRAQLQIVQWNDLCCTSRTPKTLSEMAPPLRGHIHRPAAALSRNLPDTASPTRKAVDHPCRQAQTTLWAMVPTARHGTYGGVARWLHECASGLFPSAP